MLTIGELAAAARTTTRTVRHYHSIGLLPEPARRTNGYRSYDVQAVLRLVRIRRLTQLGLSLPEVEVALAGANEQDLRVMLGDLVADLARQETEIREQRERLVALLAREHDLTLPSGLAEIFREVRRLVPDETLVRHEGDLLELLEATTAPDWFSELSAQYAAALSDSALVERSTALARRFHALTALEPADPEVAATAAEFLAFGQGSFDVPTPEGTTGTPEQERMWSVYRAGLAPAQQRCIDLAEQDYHS